jgi:hypothetical protein
VLFLVWVRSSAPQYTPAKLHPVPAAYLVSGTSAADYYQRAVPPQFFTFGHEYDVHFGHRFSVGTANRQLATAEYHSTVNRHHRNLVPTVCTNSRTRIFLLLMDASGRHWILGRLVSSIGFGMQSGHGCAESKCIWNGGSAILSISLGAVSTCVYACCR